MRLSGPALLLADTDTVDQIEPDEMYLVGVSGTGLGIAPGRDLSSTSTICARVLLCCRPHMRAPTQAASNSTLMQL